MSSDQTTVTENEQSDKKQAEKELTEKQKEAEAKSKLFEESEKKAVQIIKSNLDAYDEHEKKRSDVIWKIAHEIEVLAGINKTDIARIMATGFKMLKRHTVSISYLYQVLGDEYKDERIRKQSSESAKKRIRLGWDPKTKDWIMDLEDVEEIKLGLYSRSTLLNIIDLYIKRVATLTEENTELKKRLDVISKA